MDEAEEDALEDEEVLDEDEALLPVSAPQPISSKSTRLKILERINYPWENIDSPRHRGKCL